MSAMERFWSEHKHKKHCPIPPPPHATYDIDAVIHAALLEDDAGLGDATSLATIPKDAHASATFLCKADGVLAGTAVADAVFAACDPAISVTWHRCDGDKVSRGEKLGSVAGNARAVLRAERIALNFMQRMSGIATATAAMVAACAGTHAKVLETRKTVPGLRVLDKWAVLIGGGCNHRIGLHDMIMIKDNHIAAAGSLRAAVDSASNYSAAQSRSIPIEVETSTIQEVQELLQVLDSGGGKGVTRVMLDNMAEREPSCPGGVDITLLQEAVHLIGGRLETEASGNVTLETVGAIAQSGCDFISCGALTHSVKALDISFNISVQPR